MPRLIDPNRKSKIEREQSYPAIGTLKEGLIAWMNQHRFDRFVTLTFNNDSFSVRPGSAPGTKAERALRQWDAMVNRKAIGPRWQKSPEDRIFAFFFLEKPEVNPHWHGLIRFHGDPARRDRVAQSFDQHANDIWLKQIRSGTCDIRVVDTQIRVVDYVAKEVQRELQFERWIAPDQFRRDLT